jgi:hypothetical protein
MDLGGGGKPTSQRHYKVGNRPIQLVASLFFELNGQAHPRELEEDQGSS